MSLDYVEVGGIRRPIANTSCRSVGVVTLRFRLVSISNADAHLTVDCHHRLISAAKVYRRQGGAASLGWYLRPITTPTAVYVLFAIGSIALLLFKELPPEPPQRLQKPAVFNRGIFHTVRWSVPLFQCPRRSERGTVRRWRHSSQALRP